MSERLRDNPDELDALVGVTADALGMPAVYVEKDFWVTEVLRAASEERSIALTDGSLAPVKFTFKGGTSLSRVFGIVERFSEDVDLLAEFPADTSLTARHKVLKLVDQSVRDHLSLPGDRVTVGSSTTGVKRYTTYAYPTATTETSLKEGVLLELGSRGGTHPSAAHSYRSLVAEHAITVIGEAETAWEEFAPFDVNVLAPERTLFEELAAVHDAASRNDTTALLNSVATSTTSIAYSRTRKWSRYLKQRTRPGNSSLSMILTSRAPPQDSLRPAAPQMDMPPARHSTQSTSDVPPSKPDTTPHSNLFTESASH